ncbi:MAG: hypothetical protein ACRDL5_18755, partial [Solirubrobacteraceae bacterium]
MVKTGACFVDVPVMERRSKPFGGRLFLWIVGGPPRKDAEDPKTETFRFLRRFFLRVYMPFSLV